MTPTPSYHRHRFPADIISHAVWLYHVFSLSLRDVELILVERGVVVTHESIPPKVRRRICQTAAPTTTAAWGYLAFG
jgi:transposase-like protein